MKKHLIAVAVAAAVAAPAAMADTTLYGLVHGSIDYIDNDDQSDVNIASNSSRLGVKGSEKISSGLSAIYQFETQVDFVEGNDLFTDTRNSFVGLSGGFGTALIGKHDTPMKLMGRKYDLFGDQIGDSRNLINKGSAATAGFDLRPGNVAAYISPNMSGFQVIGAYVTDHDQLTGLTGEAGPNTDSNDFDAYSISAGYAYKKLFTIDAAYEQHNIADPILGVTTEDSEDAFRVGAAVNFAGFTVNGLYHHAEDFNDIEYDAWGAGVGYTFGKNTIKGQYYSGELDVSGVEDMSMAAIGYDYAMSKQTTLYAAYAIGMDGTTPWKSGHGVTTAGSTTEDNTAFSVGVKHKF